MTPNDILNRIPKPGRCVDCMQDAILTDRKDPLCEQHARALGVIPDEAAKPLNMAVCSFCSYAYNADEWTRCPNSMCISNQRSVYDDLLMDGDDPEPYFPEG